jgi:hypothetical protein
MGATFMKFGRAPATRQIRIRGRLSGHMADLLVADPLPKLSVTATASSARSVVTREYKIVCP